MIGECARAGRAAPRAGPRRPERRPRLPLSRTHSAARPRHSTESGTGAATPCRRGARRRAGRARTPSSRRRVHGGRRARARARAPRASAARRARPRQPARAGRRRCRAAPAVREPRSAGDRRDAPLAAACEPLLARAEVIDIAEAHRAHRRAVGDRDRDGVRERARAWRCASRRSGRSPPSDARPRSSTAPRSSESARRSARRPHGAGRARRRSRVSASASIASVWSPPSPMPIDGSAAQGCLAGWRAWPCAAPGRSVARPRASRAPLREPPYGHILGGWIARSMV